MTAKAITFPPWQVLAALDDRVRRVTVPVKPQPEPYTHGVTDHLNGWKWPPGAEFPKRHSVWRDDVNPSLLLSWACPYQPDTELWVRETWAVDRKWWKTKPSEIPDGWGDRVVYYKANGPGSIDWMSEYCGRWRSPVTMPKWASRLRYRVTGVRVQRVGTITRDEAMAEGVPQTTGDHEYDNRTTIENFAALWQSRHGDRYPWESNPWARVLKLKPEKV